jgi:hypothetical protein
LTRVEHCQTSSDLDRSLFIRLQRSVILRDFVFLIVERLWSYKSSSDLGTYLDSLVIDQRVDCDSCAFVIGCVGVFPELRPEQSQQVT